MIFIRLLVSAAVGGVLFKLYGLVLAFLGDMFDLLRGRPMICTDTQLQGLLILAAALGGVSAQIFFVWSGGFFV